MNLSSQSLFLKKIYSPISTPNIFNSQNLEHLARVSQISNQNNITVYFYENAFLGEYYKTLMMNTIYHTYMMKHRNLLSKL